jgi:hypothetical protein
MGLLDFIAPGKNQKAAQVASSTQTHLRIAEIRDSVVVLKNGGVRCVLKTSSINFNLKSEQEQNAIIYSYQGFLNSLEFPIQILVRSKKLDIDNYIDQVYELSEKQENKLLQEQTVEYAQYIRRLVEYSDIMEKEFFVIVPYDPPRAQNVSKIQSFFQRLSPKDSYNEVKRRRTEFNDLKKSLLQRVNVVQAGLENCGLSVDILDTLELINLFYESYNPKTSRDQKLRDLENTAIETDEEKITNEESQQNIEAEEMKARMKDANKTPEASEELKKPDITKEPSLDSKPAENVQNQPVEAKPAETKPTENVQPTPAEAKPAENVQPAPAEPKPAENVQPTPAEAKPAENVQPTPAEAKPAEKPAVETKKMEDVPI